jgi:disulfide bond formation protein DsbB
MSDNSTESPRLFTALALLASAVAVGGSLWLSMGMGLFACPLCFYQRAFAMSAMGVLVVGVLARMTAGPYLSLVALAPTTGGLGVAGWHVYLELTGKLECPQGLFEIGTAPQQSLAIFGILFILLSIDIARSCCAGGTCNKSAAFAGFTAFILGGLFALGCIRSVPGPKDVPLAESLKTGELKICRPPAK